MAPAIQSGRFELILIAQTGERFRDFAPYVASTNPHGVVAFQATLHDGRTGVFTGTGGEPAPQVSGDGAGDFYSHPDICEDGSLCAFAARRSGGQRLLRLRGGWPRTLADTGGAFKRIGPLGPTMNDSGQVAFRADTAAGAGIFRGDGGPTIAVADRTRFSHFHGLPVINRQGAVVFRADSRRDVQGIYLWEGRGKELETVVDSTREFDELGFFPCFDDTGSVTFSATRAGEPGIFRAWQGRIDTLVDSLGPFESFRGSLNNGSGPVLFYATPRGGNLGVYAGLDVSADKVLAVGDPLLGSMVVELALNPVSLNEVGQVAVRLALADGGQAVVRADTRPLRASSLPERRTPARPSSSGRGWG